MKERFTQAFKALMNRRFSYRVAFEGVHGDRVLRDLAKFCRAHQSTFHEDARVHAVMEGRREVWLRIQEQLQLNDEQLWERYGGIPVEK